MAQATHPGVGQGPLPFEGTQPRHELGIDWEQPVTFSHLLNVLSDTETSRQAMGATAVEDLAIIDPVDIRLALYTGNAHDDDVDNAWRGLVFPADDYKAIVSSPVMLAKRIRARAESEYQNRPHLVEAVKKRKAREGLEGRVVKLEDRRAAIQAEVDCVRVVAKEARSGGRAHYRADKLYPKVVQTKDTIGNMIGVAGKRLGWSVDEHVMAKRALTVVLFGLHGDGNQRTRHWLRYTEHTLEYAQRRDSLLRTSQSNVLQELRKYQ